METTTTNNNITDWSIELAKKAITILSAKINIYTYEKQNTVKLKMYTSVTFPGQAHFHAFISQTRNPIIDRH